MARSLEESCLKMDGPSTLLISDKLTVTLSLTCASLTSSDAEPRLFSWECLAHNVSSPSPATSVLDRQSSWAGDTLQLDTPDLDSMFPSQGDVSADVEVKACVRMNATALHAAELRLCAACNVTMQRNFAPTITLNGFGSKVSPGRDIVLDASIDHHLKSRNVSLSSADIASFSYQWSMQRTANSETGRPGATVDLTLVPSSRSRTLRVPKQLLEPLEAYQVTFAANMTKVYGASRGVVSLTDVLSTSGRDVVALINSINDFQRIPASDRSLRLDADSASYDPEKAINSSRIFQWTCINNTAPQHPCVGAQVSSSGGVYTLPSDSLVFPSSLNITLNFSVISNGGTLRRSSSFKAFFSVISPGSPTLVITGHAFVVSRGGDIRLTANLVWGSSTSNGGDGVGAPSISYRWESRRNLSSSSASSSSPLAFLASTTSLVLPVSQLANIVHGLQKDVAISAVAMEGGTEIARSTVNVKIVEVPQIQSVRATPMQGDAYTSDFEVAASVVISDEDALPVLTSFSYYPQYGNQSKSKVLCPFSFAAGNHTILAKVKDSLDGVSQAQIGPIQVREVQYPAFAPQSTECMQTSQAIFALRKMTEESYPALQQRDNSSSPDGRDSICKSLNQTLGKLFHLGQINDMLSLARTALDAIDTIPNQEVLLSTCPDFAGALAATATTTGGPKGCSSTANLQELSSDMWSIAASHVEKVALIPDLASGEENLMIAEVLEESVETEAFTEGPRSTEEVQNVLNAVNSITVRAEPIELASALGDALAHSYSAVLVKASPPASSPEASIASAAAIPTSCSVVDETVSSMDLLLRKAGGTSPPQSNVHNVRFETSGFDASAGTVFAEETAASSASSTVRVSIGATTIRSSSDGYERPRNVLTLLRVAVASLAQCRQQQQQQQQQQQFLQSLGGTSFRVGAIRTNAVADFASSDVASVNLYNMSGSRLLSFNSSSQGRDSNANVTIALSSDRKEKCGLRRVCSFWNPLLQVWSDEGCVYNGTVDGGLHACVCNHLTEFTLLADQATCAAEENDAEFGYWGMVGLFGVIAAVAILQVARLGKGGFRIKHVVWTHLLIFAVAITRIVSVLMVSDQNAKLASLTAVHLLSLRFS
eukprot:jgi/Bigna1/137893/aug1.41_g12601